MQESLKILFQKDGRPIDHRRIKVYVSEFPKRYHEVVEKIIKKSEKLDKVVFSFNVATLLPSFGMARRGAFHGIGVDRNGIPSDPNGVIDVCWKQVGDKLQKLKRYINDRTIKVRYRVLADLSPKSRDYTIRKSSELFQDLLKVSVTINSRMHGITRVGASKVLFSVLPEIALPVDTQQWRYVFRTVDYQKILSTMVNEIEEWERRTTRQLDEVASKLTLPAIYNVMAMEARPSAHAA